MFYYHLIKRVTMAAGLHSRGDVEKEKLSRLALNLLSPVCMGNQDRVICAAPASRWSAVAGDPSAEE